MVDRSDELRGVFVKYIRENKLKNTRQRDVIFETFISLDGHATIETLLKKVQESTPGVGYATVYRALKLFVAADVASERRFGDGPTMYEVADMGDHHDHLICTRCGRIFEFEDDLIERRQEEVAKGLGLRLTNHRMTLWGECVDRKVCDAHTAK